MRSLGNFLNCTRRKESFETESAISPAISEPMLVNYLCRNMGNCTQCRCADVARLFKLPPMAPFLLPHHWKLGGLLSWKLCNITHRDLKFLPVCIEFGSSQWNLQNTGENHRVSSSVFSVSSYILVLRLTLLKLGGSSNTSCFDFLLGDSE